MSSLIRHIDDLFWLLLVIVVVLMAATKPSEAAHRQAIAQRTPVFRTLFGMAELVGAAELKYHDYFVVSVMTAKFDNSGNEIPVSFGLVGHVYYSNDR